MSRSLIHNCRIMNSVFYDRLVAELIDQLVTIEEGGHGHLGRLIQVLNETKDGDIARYGNSARSITQERLQLSGRVDVLEAINLMTIHHCGGSWDEEAIRVALEITLARRMTWIARHHTRFANLIGEPQDLIDREIVQAEQGKH